MEFIKNKVFKTLSDWLFIDEFDEVYVEEERIRFYENCDLAFDIEINTFGEAIIKVEDVGALTEAELADYATLLSNLKECIKK